MRIAALISPLLVCSALTASPARQLKLVTPSGYLPEIPILVRVEITDSTGQRDWSLWDAEAILSSDAPGIVLSTNRVVLRNGLGSALVSISGDGGFHLTAALDNLQTNRFIQTLTSQPVTTVGGILPGASSTWSCVVLITSDVIVPLGHTLTIQSNTLVLIEGVTNGVEANDLAVYGAVQALGTENAPITITCANPDLQYRWGQIRHIYAQPSLYRYTTITRGGRSTPEGQTGTAPVIRPTASKITFESCNLTDFAETSKSSPDFGQPGKVLQSDLGCDLTFNNCLMARARMGPEIAQTALVLTNSYIVEMRGIDDSDGIFLAAQNSGQNIILSACVIADGDDDGIDTLGAIFTVDRCLVRNWRNPFEDSKGISLEGGEARIWHSLLVDNAVGISGKGDNGVTVRVRLDHCTVLSEYYALGATNKAGTTPIIDYRATNSILQGVVDSIFTQYNPADIRLDYCNLGESWMGSGNSVGPPLFVNAAGHDYRLLPSSPCIDTGAPGAALDPDGSRTDIGYFTFVPPPPRLSTPQVLGAGGCQLQLNAYPHRNYVLEFSTRIASWQTLTTIFQTSNSVAFTDPASNQVNRFYRARLAP